MKDSTSFNLCLCGCGAQIEMFSKSRGEIKRFKHGHHAKGSGNGRWKGGRRARHGYIQIWKPDHHFADVDGYVMEHRLVWEEANNACLLPGTDVHHINEKKDDNRIENLETMTKSQHLSHHNKGKIRVDMTGRICAVCGSDKTRVFVSGRPHWFHYKKEGFMCGRCYDRLKYYG